MSEEKNLEEIDNKIICPKCKKITKMIIEKISDIILSNNKIEELIKQMETYLENIINNNFSEESFDTQIKNIKTNFNEINDFIKNNTKELQQLFNSINNNGIDLTNKNRIRVALDIKLKENNDIILYNIDDNQGIDVYLNNEKIKMIKEENNKYKIDYIFEKEKIYIFDIVFNDIKNSLEGFFNECSNIISIDLNYFDSSNVTNMSYIFHKCERLKEIKGLDKLNTNKVKDMNTMFGNCSELEYLDLSNFDTNNVTDMSYMFNKCNKLKEIKGLDKFNTNKVINMKAMFQECGDLEYLDLSNFDTSNVTNMLGMFNECNQLKEIKGLNKFITDKVTDMNIMFQECNELEYLDLTNFNTSNVTNMSFMFNYCIKLKEIKGLNKFITNKVTDMDTMFGNCNELKNIDLSNFNTINVTNMSCMFAGCNKLKNIKGINKFNTKKVINMKGMFGACNELELLDLSNFNTANVTNMECMFCECNNLKYLNLLNFTINCPTEDMLSFQHKDKCKFITNNRQLIKLFNNY